MPYHAVNAYLVRCYWFSSLLSVLCVLNSEGQTSTAASVIVYNRQGGFKRYHFVQFSRLQYRVVRFIAFLVSEGDDAVS